MIASRSPAVTVSLLLAVLTALLLTSCAGLRERKIVRSSAALCFLSGGERELGWGGWACPKRYSDGGKLCADSSECSGQCFYENEVPREIAAVRDATGRCEANDRQAGKPCYSVEGGRLVEAACLEE